MGIFILVIYISVENALAYALLREVWEINERKPQCFCNAASLWFRQYVAFTVSKM